MFVCLRYADATFFVVKRPFTQLFNSHEKRTLVGYVVKMFYAGQSHLIYIQCENGGHLAYIVVVQNIGKVGEPTTRM